MIRTTFRSAALAAALAGLGTGAATAQTAETPDFAYAIDTAGWRGGAFTQADGTTFSHCGIGRQYQNGITLLFTRTRRGDTNVVLLSDQFAMNPQTPTVAARVTVDGGAWDETYPAVPAGSTALAIPLGAVDELIEQLRRGNALSIQTPLVTFEFALSGTFNALPRLAECIDAANAALPPLPPVPEAPAAATDGAPEFEGMPREALASLLRAAGLTEVAIVPAEQIPDDELALQFAWTLGPMIGGLQQLPRDIPGLSVERFIERFYRLIEARCEGEFAARVSDSAVFQDRYALALGEIQCAGPEATSYMAVTFVLDDNFYSAFFHEADLENVDMVRNASGSIASVIRRLAEASLSEGEAPAEGDGPAEGDAPADGETPTGN